jgi:Protein of unknown function (DUF2726)
MIELLPYVLIALLAVVLLWRFTQRKREDEVTPPKRVLGPARERADLDIVGAWPPSVTRALTGAERDAREVLMKGLPECLILAQVPLARFIKVPRRNSYTEWLRRAGYMSADLLVCDRTSLVLAVVSIQAERESPRAKDRRAVMMQVLKAAGVKMLVWREAAIPTPEDARAMVERRVDVIAATKAAETVIRDEDVTPPARSLPRSIPVPEVRALDMSELEPQSSTWFDELESGRISQGFSDTQPGSAFDDARDVRR